MLKTLEIKEKKICLIFIEEKLIKLKKNKRSHKEVKINRNIAQQIKEQFRKKGKKYFYLDIIF
jgi:hypothetical protein